MSLSEQQLRNIIEGALLAAGQPLNLDKLQALFDPDEQPEKEQLRAALETIDRDCAERGFELKEVASGWRFQVRDDLAPWINKLWEEKPQKYSRALLETLALITYRQPITRGDIEQIRGVTVSSHILKTLQERDWVRVVGHRDVPGRPALYATTKTFLDYFNLKSLEELPPLGEIRDLDEINAELDLGDQPGGQAGANADDAADAATADAVEDHAADDGAEDDSESAQAGMFPANASASQSDDAELDSQDEHDNPDDDSAAPPSNVTSLADVAARFREREQHEDPGADPDPVDAEASESSPQAATDSDGNDGESDAQASDAETDAPDSHPEPRD